MAVDKVGKHFVLVDVAELACPRLHLVGGEIGFGGAAQLLVQDPERAVLAFAGGDEVAG
jgi:hypothetical protein